MCGLITCLAVATTLAIHNGGRDASQPGGLHTSGSRNLRSAALGLLLISPLAVDAAQDSSIKHLPKMTSLLEPKDAAILRTPMSLLETKDVATRLDDAPELPRAAVEPRGKHSPKTMPNAAQEFRSQHPPKTTPTTQLSVFLLQLRRRVGEERAVDAWPSSALRRDCAAWERP